MRFLKYDWIMMKQEKYLLVDTTYEFENIVAKSLLLT